MEIPIAEPTLSSITPVVIKHKHKRSKGEKPMYTSPYLQFKKIVVMRKQFDLHK